MLSPTGDYTFGQGSANFWSNSPQGVAQSVQTRLLLWEGEWFLNTTEGTPFLQQVLGYNAQTLRDLAIKQRVLNTPGVTSINEYDSTVNPTTRAFTVTMSITTQYSVDPVSLGPLELQ